VDGFIRRFDTPTALLAFQHIHRKRESQHRVNGCETSRGWLRLVQRTTGHRRAAHREKKWVKKWEMGLGLAFDTSRLNELVFRQQFLTAGSSQLL
jgi:hypothetical protein